MCRALRRLRPSQRCAGSGRPLVSPQRVAPQLAGSRTSSSACGAAPARRASHSFAIQSRLWQASPLARVRDAAAPGALARLQRGLERVRRARERLLPLVRTLHAVSPLATLERGYAIVTTSTAKILRDAADAAAGHDHRGAARAGPAFAPRSRSRDCAPAALCARPDGALGRAASPRAPAAGMELPRESAVPGGVKIIRLERRSATSPPTSRPTGTARWSCRTAAPGSR